MPWLIIVVFLVLLIFLLFWNSTLTLYDLIWVNIALHICSILLLFPINFWCKRAHFHLFLLLLELCEPNLFFLLSSLLPYFPLLSIDINLDLVLHIVLMHDHILLGYQKIGSLLMIKFLNELVIRLIEILSLLNLILPIIFLIVLVGIFLLWLNFIFISPDIIFFLISRVVLLRHLS